MFRATHRTTLGVVALSTAFIAGCTEMPTQSPPRQRAPTPLLNVSAGSRTPKLYPNAVKYRDRGLKPATARSGSASLTARALIARDGVTQLEMTTGTLDDDGVAPGTLAKVQLKVRDADGHDLLTRNHNRLDGGGYASFSLTGIGRGDRVQVHGNVRGIDRNRTDVVVVTEMVKRRPDLAVTELATPARALVNVPVDVVAEVREQNGDVGARANCVLAVNGSPVVSARGIWVDALGVVSCSFRYAFPAVGTARIAVSVSDARPGDYDDSNNSREGEVVVEDQAEGSRYFVTVGDQTDSFSFRNLREGTYGPDDENGTGTFRRYEVAERFTWIRQFSSMLGRVDQELTFPIRDVRFTHATNGSVLLSGAYDDLSADSFRDDASIRVSCGTRREVVGANLGTLSTTICSGVNRDGVGGEFPFTTFEQHRQTSEITYFAAVIENELHIVYQDGRVVDQVWTDNFLTDQPAIFPPYGPDFRFTLSFTAAGHTYVNDALIALTPYRLDGPNSPWTCAPWSEGPYAGQQCVEVTNWVISGINGSVVGTGTVESMVAEGGVQATSGF
jgi:hypothetical protein